MLTISKQQFALLEKAKLAEFCITVKNYLTKYYPSEFFVLGDAEDQQIWVKKVVTDALNNGFEREEDIYSYVRAAITFDEDFSKLLWAKKVFELSVMPSTKASLLNDALADELDKISEKAVRERAHLLNEKALNYAKEKASYVYSFNIFYGLDLNDIDDAEKWTLDVVNKAMTFDFTDDFLLDSYLEVALYFGKTYHTKDWAKKILAQDISVGEKNSALLSYLSTNFGQQDAKS